MSFRTYWKTHLSPSSLDDDKTANERLSFYAFLWCLFLSAFVRFLGSFYPKNDHFNTRFIVVHSIYTCLLIKQHIKPYLCIFIDQLGCEWEEWKLIPGRVSFQGYKRASLIVKLIISQPSFTLSMQHNNFKLHGCRFCLSDVFFILYFWQTNLLISLVPWPRHRQQNMSFFPSLHIVGYYDIVFVYLTSISLSNFSFNNAAQSQFTWHLPRRDSLF